jgi:hypothetical protein
MRNKKRFLTATLCAFSMMINSAAAIAQSKDKQQDPKPTADPAPEIFNRLLPAPPNQFSFIQSEFSFGGPVVKGAPYSAEAVTETIQTLGDGNRIIHNSSAKIYRDSAGRTRHEQSLKAIGPWAVSGEAPVMISIDDPIASAHYNLDSNTKTAHKMIAHPDLAMIALDAARAKMKDKMTMQAPNGAEAGASASGGAGFRVVTDGPSQTIVNVATADGPAPKFAIAGVRGGPVAVATPGIPAPGFNAVYSWGGEGEVNTESLGKQTIEGVEAEGQRITVTIQAGKIGNERPIVTVNERWYSPDLQTVVLSKNSDPRIGETTYKLVNIDRNEPDPSLFQVPTDYTVEEGPGFGPMPLEPVKKFDIERRVKRPNEN